MIQPLDIKTQKFKKGLFGYKPGDVDEFVSTVARAYEEAFNENAKLKEENERLNKVVGDNNLKIHELEKQLQSSTKDTPKKEAPKKEEPKKGGSKFEDVPLKDSGIKDGKKKDDSAASKFIKQAEETTVVGGDDDEVFVGEIEEARKPGKAMIGDGEEGEGDDFEFL
ncbi:MAG: DivIVA domain-containing protein [Eubacterium sp.]|nr:DivIVA domain-containing protein [Eubacterium sp.]